MDQETLYHAQELSDKPEDEYPGKSNDEFPGMTFKAPLNNI